MTEELPEFVRLIVSELHIEIERLQAEVVKLRAAGHNCPWCFREKQYGPVADCPRQAVKK